MKKPEPELLLIMMNQIAIMEALAFNAPSWIKSNLDLHRKKTDEWIVNNLSKINQPTAAQKDEE